MSSSCLRLVGALALALAACSSGGGGIYHPYTSDAGTKDGGVTLCTSCPGSTACVEILTDKNNCGRCGNACASGQSCVSGACQSSGMTPNCVTPQVACGGVCVNVLSDASNCGGCGVACGANQTCQSGGCVASGLNCTGSTQDCGTGRCVNVLSDTSNCGGCGNTCNSGERCQSGTCTLVCTGSTTNCSGQCVSLANDPNNCGACGNACGSGGSCSGGSCASAMTGCKTLFNCFVNCASGDTTCQDTCWGASTSNAMTYFNDFGNCLDTYCPTTNTTDACNQSNPNYATTCKQCVMGATTNGGNCYTQYTTCLNDTP